MEPTDTLVLFSEISVALAGFTGIVVTIGKSNNPVSNIRIQVAVLGSLQVLLFSIAPILLLTAMSSEKLAWQVASLTHLAFIVLYYLMHLPDVKMVLRDGSVVEKLFTAGDFCASIALAINGLGFNTWDLAAVYLIVLSWILFQASFQFYVSVESLWKGNDNA